MARDGDSTIFILQRLKGLDLAFSSLNCSLMGVGIAQDKVMIMLKYITGNIDV